MIPQVAIFNSALVGKDRDLFQQHLQRGVVAIFNSAFLRSKGMKKGLGSVLMQGKWVWNESAWAVERIFNKMWRSWPENSLPSPSSARVKLFRLAWGCISSDRPWQQ
jgi:hypothetical protein